MPHSNALLQTWGLPPEILGRLGRHAGRQRTMLHDGHLLIILHKLPGPDDTTREAVFFYRSPNGDWKASSGNGIKAIAAHLQTYVDELIRLNREVEKASLAQEYFHLFNLILPIARSAANQHEALQEAREALKQDQDIISFRDEAYDIKRTAELLREEAQHGLDYRAAQRAEQQAIQAERQAQSAHRLNMVAAWFFPVTAIASIFGVNLVTGLESIQTPLLFWGLMIFSFALGLFLRKSLDSRNPPDK